MSDDVCEKSFQSNLGEVARLDLLRLSFLFLCGCVALASNQLVCLDCKVLNVEALHLFELFELIQLGLRLFRANARQFLVLRSGVFFKLLRVEGS